MTPPPLMQTSYLEAPQADADQPTNEIVEEAFSRKIRRHRPTEVAVKRVIAELGGFLGRVRDQVPVHAAVHQFPVFVQAGLMREVKLASPVRLFLVTHHFRHISP